MKISGPLGVQEDAHTPGVNSTRTKFTTVSLNQFTPRAVNIGVLLVLLCTPHSPVAAAKEILWLSSYCLSATRKNKRYCSYKLPLPSHPTEDLKREKL